MMKQFREKGLFSSSPSTPSSDILNSQEDNRISDADSMVDDEKQSDLCLNLENSDDEEDQFFENLLAMKQENSGGFTFHLYKVTISKYTNLPLTDKILKKANLMRVNPISRIGPPFNIYLYEEKNAIKLQKFIIESGGKAEMKQL